MANNNNIGKTKRSTDDLINSAIAQQNDWMENRRTFARRFLKTLNIFARPNPDKNADANAGDVKRDNCVRIGFQFCARWWLC